MSEYAEIKINYLSLYSFRNYLISDVVGLLFSKNDLIITPDYVTDPEDDDCEPITKYEYVTTVERAQERLDALGYSLKRMESLFNEKGVDIIDYDPFLNHLRVDYDIREEKTRKRIEKYITFRKWVNSVTKIAKYELNNGKIDKLHKGETLNPSTECDKVIYYSLISDEPESYYGLNLNEIHIGYVFRIILEGCNKDDIIVLDFTDLGNWNDDCIPKAIEASQQIEKTVVLVEGTSDKDILEFAIDKMYPHLADLFYFMDFSDGHGNKRGGGTPEMTKCMETFYYSRLKSRFIAIFDNDAEGYISRNKLLNKLKTWPDNFRILCYPSMNEFNNYPTLATNGKVLCDNINCRAASIELYLPDCLISDSDGYLPIEWEARKQFETPDGSSKYLYQGVISNKEIIKKNFHNTCRQIERKEMKFDINEWGKMKELLKTIVFAF
jgi:hypothetical protein